MHWVNLILGCLRMDDNDDDEGWVVTKNWDSPAATVGGYWRSWPRGGAGNKQKFLSIWFENSPNLPFSREAQRNSRRMMDEELSGRKIWVICQVWSESSSRHVSTAVEKLGSWADSSFFPNVFWDKAALLTIIAIYCVCSCAAECLIKQIICIKLYDDFQMQKV